MCSHYEAPTSAQLAATFSVQVEQGTLDLWPGYLGPFLRRSTSVGEMDDEVPGLEGLHGSFGLIPQWSKDTKICRRTYNARSETGRRINPYRLHMSLKTFKEKDNDLSIWERELIFVTFCEACHERSL
jgi:putative SOS response-associated peptidase YedK